jgi:hypothetical protein
VLTVYGVCALAFMLAMYALERRGPLYILGFVIGCLLSSLYGFLSGAWPFGVIEAVWALLAFRRFLHTPKANTGEPPRESSGPIGTGPEDQRG